MSRAELTIGLVDTAPKFFQRTLKAKAGALRLFYRCTQRTWRTGAEVERKIRPDIVVEMASIFEIIDAVGCMLKTRARKYSSNVRRSDASKWG